MMKRNLGLPALVKMASLLKLRDQKVLIDVEDEIAADRLVNVIEELDAATKHYLLLSTLPFVMREHVKGAPSLDALWPDIKHERRLVYPTGNLHPVIMVVGDAPSDSGYAQVFGRAWTYKPTSHLLRVALFRLGVHHATWYTNLLKESLPDNRPSTDEEVEAAIPMLQREIKLLKPQLVIALGTHVRTQLNYHGIDHRKVYHPSYHVRKGTPVQEYMDEIRPLLKGLVL